MLRANGYHVTRKMIHDLIRETRRLELGVWTTKPDTPTQPSPTRRQTQAKRRTPKAKKYPGGDSAAAKARAAEKARWEAILKTGKARPQAPKHGESEPTRSTKRDLT
jgi:hypothetical protein